MSRFNPAVLCAVAIALGACSSGPDGTSSSAPPAAADDVAPIEAAARAVLRDPAELAKLRGIALASSSQMGVPSPRTMHAVAASDHQAAELVLSGAVINDHAPVYVIKMTGGPFTATFHPRQAAAPQGKFLTVTVDATTHRVTDVGFVDEEPDLSRIGPEAVDLAAP